jgi:4-amino-4-deoxy-L-arabinose transferase-like glycosyltransferase
VSRRVERLLLAGVLGLFLVLGVAYSIVVPPFEASDELWHYPMVKFIADHWDLPVQDPANVGPWRQEGSQPPLYYALAAAATSWIDTSDVEEARHLNPHVDNGIATADGNINLVVHHPTRETFPWRGTVLAVHLVRLLSVLMGAAAVYLTYLLVRQILPDRPALALGAAAVHAFTPMVLFISGAVNNDNLVVPLSTLALLLIIRVKDPSPISERRDWELWALGVVLGLGALTKTSSLGLTLLTALAVTVRAVRRRSWRALLQGSLATLLPFLVIAGWWYGRNLRLYGDLTGFNVFFEILGIRDVPADLSQLWRERFSFLAGYWGNFGGLNVPMAPWTYAAMEVVVVVAGLGVIAAVVRSQVRCRRPGAGGSPDSQLSFIICILWALLVSVPWLWWARVTWSSQGRLVFPAISVWSMLLVLGLAAWFPRRWGEWAVGGLALFLLGLSTAAPFVWISPAYAPPEPLTDAQLAAIPQRSGVEFGGVLRLVGFDVQGETVQPGGEVGVTLYWEALAPADRDYTTFVHLLGEGELSVAQRDTFPGLGRLSTTWLRPGFRWADRYVVPVPDTAYAPDAVQVEVGLYDASTGERLPVNQPDGVPLGDNVRFGGVVVQPRPGDLPNPIAVNFGDRMELVGYDLSSRVVYRGETLTLTLHWRGLRAMGTNYTVSAQLVDAAQRKAAQWDGWPLDGEAPTAAWMPGQRVTDVRALDVYAEAPAGVYDLRLAVYVLEEGQILHLPVIPEGGEMLSDHVVLTRVRVQ